MTWTAKRFYSAAEVAPADGGGHFVALDGKPVHTPARALLRLPTRALAEAVAAEWAAQDDVIRPDTMPVTKAANAALDRVAPRLGEVADMLAAYGETDLLCHRAEAPPGLVARQADAWDPWLDWAATAHGARLVVVAGVMPAAQPAEALSRLRAAVAAHDPFRLTALHEFVTVTGSVVLGLALSSGALDPERAWATARIDEAWQAEQWGEDAEAADAAARRLAALHQAAALLRMAA